MVKRFKSFEAFRKHSAFIHIHKIPHRRHHVIVVRGKRYKIKHTDKFCPYCLRRKRGR